MHVCFLLLEYANIDCYVFLYDIMTIILFWIMFITSLATFLLMTLLSNINDTKFVFIIGVNSCKVCRQINYSLFFFLFCVVNVNEKWLYCSELLTGVVPYTDLRAEAQVSY